jgi:ubiquitin carboxyl-terminal hydrolase 4/11/15
VKPKEGQSYIYDLQGITKHSGGLGGGHYTAHAKNSETGDWLDFNDAYTSKVYGHNNVVSEEAYIFFFTKRDLPLQNDGKYDLQALKQHLSVPDL